MRVRIGREQVDMRIRVGKNAGLHESEDEEGVRVT